MENANGKPTPRGQRLDSLPSDSTVIEKAYQLLTRYTSLDDATAIDDSGDTRLSAGLCLVRRRRCDDGESMGFDPKSSESFLEALVIRRGKNAFFELPKGKMEEGESLEEAAEREMREETGLLNPVVVGPLVSSERYVIRRRMRESRGGKRGERGEGGEGVCLSVDSESAAREPGDAGGGNSVWRGADASVGDSGASGDSSFSGGNNNVGSFNTVVKRVVYFSATLGEMPHSPHSSTGQMPKSSDNPSTGKDDALFPKCYFGKRECATKEVRWVALEEVQASLFLKSQPVRQALFRVLSK